LADETGPLSGDQMRAASADVAIITFTALMSMMARAFVCQPHTTRINPPKIQTKKSYWALMLPIWRTPSQPIIPRPAPEYSRKVLRVTGIMEHAHG
jgi:hypothetical protein